MATSGTLNRAQIHVAVGIVRNTRGEVLLAQRPKGTHLAGFWEFPGGKLERGETVQAALKRELAEELGVQVISALPLIRVTHDYQDRTVLLDTWEVMRYRGMPHGREGQPVAWVAVDSLGQHALPSADRPIVAALRLSETYLVVGEPSTRERDWLQRFHGELQSGARLICLRPIDSSQHAAPVLMEPVRALCREFGARILLQADPETALRWHADGVHLDSTALRALRQRPLPDGKLVAATCSAVDELEHARALGLDFAVARFPAAAAEGADFWSRAAGPLPIYELGDYSHRHVPMVRRRGARGIAMECSLSEGVGA